MMKTPMTVMESTDTNLASGKSVPRGDIYEVPGSRKPDNVIYDENVMVNR